MSTLRSRSPIKLTVPAGLLDLRDQVLARSEKRMPKWKFRLAPDAVVMIQPKVGKRERVATKNGDAWEWIDFPRQFEGRLLICADADAQKLLKCPFGTLYCQQTFAISADDTGGHRIVGTGFSANTGLKDKAEREARWNDLDRQSTDTLLTAFANGTFDAIAPSMMLTPNCLLCGKGLTDPASMARGIGPECAGTSSVHAPRMQNLAGGEDEVAPVPRRPHKPPVLLTEPDETIPPVEKVFRTLDDITFVPTPVKCWSSDRGEWIEEKQRALLFDGRAPGTMIVSNIYGSPIVQVGKITLVSINEPGAYDDRGGSITLHIVPPAKRGAISFVDRWFPSDQVLIAWGMYDVDLTGLPPIVGMAWHSPNFPALWREASRRLHAVAGHAVWLDTTETSIAAWRERHPRVATEPAA